MCYLKIVANEIVYVNIVFNLLAYEKKNSPWRTYQIVNKLLGENRVTLNFTTSSPLIKAFIEILRMILLDIQ